MTGNVNWRFDGARATWTGAGGNALFTNALNWSTQKTPDATTTVEFSDGASRAIELDGDARAGRLVATSGAIRFSGSGQLHVAETMDVGDAATVTLDVPTVVSNSLSVRSGGTITHTANAAEKTYAVRLVVQGDATFASGGAIDVTGRGYAKGKGPGGGGDGGAYGGRGLYANWDSCNPAGTTYGSLLRPSELGSGGVSSAGGGSVYLSVARTLTLEGSITANGEDWSNYPGSGGSIWLTAKRFVGTSAATICARGGAATNVGAGGGGRIAVYVTGAGNDFSEFPGTILARGAGGASCGTVYLETAADGPGGGRVIYDNAANGVNKAGALTFPAMQDADSRRALAHVRLELKNTRELMLAKDVRVQDVVGQNTTTTINLNDHTLSIRSKAHHPKENDACAITGIGSVLRGANDRGRVVWGGWSPADRAVSAAGRGS